MIPCAFVACTTMIYKPWYPGVPQDQQPCYHMVLDSKYWPVWGIYNTCNIMNFTNKTTSSEDFNDNYKVVFDGISENMDLLVHTGKYGVINTTDLKKMGYYVENYLYGALILQEYTNIERQLNKPYELLVRTEYLSSIKTKTNCYWKQ